MTDGMRMYQENIRSLGKGRRSDQNGHRGPINLDG